ncbi:MAG: capsular biosynthesis protein [Microscillaceae bacterium]|nr:capsular biosynthesis protein [Microscillaceae bacterium]
MIQFSIRHFLRKRFYEHAEEIVKSPFRVDVHSHLLPGIDDGARTLEESLGLLKGFWQMGYQKVITTPHIMGDFYRNTPAIIRQKEEEVRKALLEAGIPIALEAAAEYYLDEWFIHLLEQRKEILTFGNKYLLFETGFANMPHQLFEVIFEMQTQGYQPILAHPERYVYLQENPNKLDKIVERGVGLQINLNSLNGFYGPTVKELAEKILASYPVKLLGSDCHKQAHLENLRKILALPRLQKWNQPTLLNHSL